MWGFPVWYGVVWYGRGWCGVVGGGMVSYRMVWGMGVFVSKRRSGSGTYLDLLKRCLPIDPPPTIYSGTAVSGSIIMQQEYSTTSSNSDGNMTWAATDEMAMSTAMSTSTSAGKQEIRRKNAQRQGVCVCIGKNKRSESFLVAWWAKMQHIKSYRTRASNVKAIMLLTALDGWDKAK